MSVLDRTSVAEILQSIRVSAEEALIDKVMEFQRLLQVRFQGRRCPPFRTAVVIELACREMNFDCSRTIILSKLGLHRTNINEYRADLITCEAGLGLKRKNENLVAGLSIKYGLEYMQRVRDETDIRIHNYIDALPAQQRQFVDPNNPIFLGAMFYLISQELEDKIAVDDILQIADCSKHQLNTICNTIMKTVKDENIKNPRPKITKADITLSTHRGSPNLTTKSIRLSGTQAFQKSSLQCSAALATISTSSITKSDSNQKVSAITSVSSADRNDKSMGNAEHVNNAELLKKRVAYEAWKTEQKNKKR